MNQEKSLLELFIKTASVNLFARSLAVITGVVYARFLGPEQYGIYGYVMSILALCILPVRAGIPNFIIREVANFQLEKQWKYLAGIINWSRWYVLISSFVIVLGLSIALDIGFFTSEISGLLLFGLILIPFRGLLSQQSAVLNGFRKTVLSQVPNNIVAPISALGILSFFIFKQYELTGELLVKISIIASILAFLVSIFFLQRVIKQTVEKEPPQYLYKKWHKSLMPFMLMGIVGTLNTELTSILLGWLDNTDSVAFFKVAMQGTTLIILGLNSINSVIMPQVARLYRQGDLKKTQELLSKSVKISTFVSLPIIFTLAFFGDVVIEFLFGKDYLPAYPLLVILCIGRTFNVLMGSVGLVLNMTNNEKYTLRTLLITLCTSILLLLVLIPAYSATGAAIAVSIGLIVWNVLMAIDLYRLTGLKTWLFK